MDANDKFCAISVDEMEMESSQDFDTSNKSFVGKITLGSAEGVDNHYSVVLLRGLKSSWKQVVAHEITGRSCNGLDMYQLMESTISAVREIGLSVKATVSDMGSSNVE